ncbi:GntP family permease [Actinorugispora endophytica]|uniref:GntP family gluconate:H+ symporter n=1 Tax=Actinorugispora endophytica TaxID=1605990 RepID=A0A4R6UWR4_9ACTN|nr:GntP family permease [Actinorugispora endophytica]TDQ51631.1 GntP family gluconate:H+ symporter [Actinorugispora endophytica]
MEAIEPAYGTVPLLLIALCAVGLLLFLIMKLRLHAFVALVLVSVLTALATLPLDQVMTTLTGGFGGTLASVALLVGLGVMIGRLLEVTGGAAVLANTLVRRFGKRHAPLALGVACLLFGFPIFFDAGLVVMLPIIFSVARRIGGSVLLYALPAAGAFAVMHAFVPPHPGPVAAADLIGANMGLTLLVGLVLAIPTWYIASYLFSRYAGRRWVLPVPDDLTSGDDSADGRPPHFATVLLILLLPLLLIFANTGTGTLVTSGVLDEGNIVVQALLLLGQTPVALLVTTLVAMVVLSRGRLHRQQVEAVVDGALGPVCSIILITGAGGMFGGVLRASGIGTALADSLESIGLPVIVAAFVIATCLRVAQGSATVALTTTASLIGPAVANTPGLSTIDLSLVVIAIACGSTVLSHVNDSGFWLVGRFLKMDVKTTLKTWTVMETLIGVVGFALAFAFSLVL